MTDAGETIAVVDLAMALKQGGPIAGILAVQIFAHGSLFVEMYTPKGHDPQTPHEPGRLRRTHRIVERSGAD
jgi:hypothetical protein